MWFDHEPLRRAGQPQQQVSPQRAANRRVQPSREQNRISEGGITGTDMLRQQQQWLYSKFHIGSYFDSANAGTSPHESSRGLDGAQALIREQRDLFQQYNPSRRCNPSPPIPPHTSPRLVQHYPSNTNNSHITTKQRRSNAAQRQHRILEKNQQFQGAIGRMGKRCPTTNS